MQVTETSTATPTTVAPVRTAPAFALLGAVQIVLISGITVISVALPAVQRDLGLSGTQLALVTSAYGLSFSGLLILGGRLADLFGRRRLFVLGVTLFGAASAAAAFAPAAWPMLAARFAQGAGAAAAAPAAMALVRTVFPDPARQARAVAAWGGFSGMGAVGGTLLSGVFAQWASWRLAFAVPVLAAAAAVVAAPRLLPADPPAAAVTGRRLDLPGAALATAGLTVLSYGLLERRAGLAVAGLLLLAAFAAVEARSAAPLLPLAFFASWPRVVALAAILIGAAGMSTSFYFLSLHLQQDRGLSPLLTTAVFLPYGVVLVGTGAVAGRLTGRFGSRAVLTAGLVLAAAGLALVAGLGTASLAAGLLVLPLGIGLTFAGATVTVVSGVPDNRAGLAGGVVNTAMEAGPTAGLAGLVALAGGGSDGSGHGYGYGYGFALGVAAAVFLLASVLAASLLRTRTAQP